MGLASPARGLQPAGCCRLLTVGMLALGRAAPPGLLYFWRCKNSQSEKTTSIYLSRAQGHLVAQLCCARGWVLTLGVGRKAGVGTPALHHEPGGGSASILAGSPTVFLWPHESLDAAWIGALVGGRMEP